MTAGLPASSDLHWPLAARFLEGWVVRMEFGMPTASGRVLFEAWAAWWWGVLDLVLDAQAGDDVGIRGRMASSASRACVSLRRGCGAVSLLGALSCVVNVLVGRRGRVNGAEISTIIILEAVRARFRER